MSIDFGADTFGINYHQIATNTNITIVPAGAPLGMVMKDVTHLGWWLTDQVTGGTGGKNFFDAFGFTVPIPEPSTGLLFAIGGIVGVMRRRARRK